MVLVKGEEFFYFIEFWVIELSEGKLIIVYVCFESFFVVGVYKFVIQFDIDISVKVESWLFVRDDVSKLGIVLFISMFLYGENIEKCYDDYCLEVYDSDGVFMVIYVGEEIWCLLMNFVCF